MIFSHFASEMTKMSVSSSLLLVFAAIVTSAYGLECWTCRAPTLEACIATKQLETCNSDQDSCETVVGRFRRGGSNRFLVTKGCKESSQCYSNQNKNILSSFDSTLCNDDLKFSLCRCCCEEERCNDGGLRCLENACDGKRKILHGRINCDKGNSPGSRCTAECTKPVYAVSPPQHSTSTCQENGTWSNPKPCCARPCPPYGLADIVSIFHASSLHMWHQMNRIAFLSAETTVIAHDAVKYGGFYYSGDVNPESAVYFNEYDDNQLKMQLLFLQRLRFNNTDDGKVNTGAALWFAYNNMFGPGKGARPGVPKYVMITTDRNSDDDVMEPARALRAAGIEIIVMGMHEGEATMNRTEFEEMTGHTHGHVYMPDRDVDHVGKELMEEFHGNFCANPCQHVLKPITDDDDNEGGRENNNEEEEEE